MEKSVLFTVKRKICNYALQSRLICESENLLFDIVPFQGNRSTTVRVKLIGLKGFIFLRKMCFYTADVSRFDCTSYDCSINSCVL